jgi:hypothetical protein
MPAWRPSQRLLHRIVGLVMLLPLLGWAVTGMVFFIKPGYAGAYEQLAVKTYPLDANTPIQTRAGWQEARVVKTIAGTHLLVRTDRGWQNLNPSSLQPAPVPSGDTLLRLFEDAFTANPRRYGRLTRLVDRTVHTATGVDVTLDWDRLTLQQRGRDTDRIDWLYRIHYLQWTGRKTLDKVIGLLGLVLLVTLTYLGARLAFRRS